MTFDIAMGTAATVSDGPARFDVIHPQVGDLRVSLTNVAAGVTVDLVYRLGGDSYNRNYAGEYVFNDAFADNLWTAANAANGTNVAVAAGDCFASTTTGTAVDLSAAFAGTEALGLDSRRLRTSEAATSAL